MKTKISHLGFKTPHYQFNMTVTETNEVHRRYMFLVGDENDPCLEGNIILENRTKNNRYDATANTATLIKINALQECSLEDITNDYMAKYSFGTELLNSIAFFINSQFPMIQTVSLNDRSYIPCNNPYMNTLDLLTYSIALYGKTWYEMKINAYLIPESTYANYRKQVDTYTSQETKQKLDFTDIYNCISKASNFTREIFDKHSADFKTMFQNSKTLPEFFQMISKKIERNDKCRFFKDWLERFIESYVMIHRVWYFDLFPKIEVIGKNRTRKHNNTKKVNK